MQGQDVLVVRVLDRVLSACALGIAGLLLWLATDPWFREAWAYALPPLAFGAVGIWIAHALLRRAPGARVAQVIWSSLVVFLAAAPLGRLLARTQEGDFPTGPFLLGFAVVLLAGVATLVLLFLPSSRAFFAPETSKVGDVFD